MSAENKQALVDALKSYNYPEESIQGIVANADVETGGTFSPTQIQRGGNGYGVFQFDYMRPYYNQWLVDQDRGNTIESQVDFMHQSVMGDKPFQVRKNADSDRVQAMNEYDRRDLKSILQNPLSAEEATMAFQDYYEKPGVPHSERRLDAIPEPLTAPQGVVQEADPFHWKSLIPDYFTEQVTDTVMEPTYWSASQASGVPVPELRGMNPWPDNSIPGGAEVVTKIYPSGFKKNKDELGDLISNLFGD